MSEYKLSCTLSNEAIAVDLQKLFKCKILGHETETSLKAPHYNIVLNPGSEYSIQPHDLCLYISMYKEENYNFKYAKTLDGK